MISYCQKESDPQPRPTPRFIQKICPSPLDPKCIWIGRGKKKIFYCNSIWLLMLFLKIRLDWHTWHRQLFLTMKTMPTRVRRNTKQTITRKMLKPIAMKPEICARQIIHNGTYGWNIIILKFQFIFEINNCGWPFPSSILFLLSMVVAAGQIGRLQTNRWRWWQPQSCHPSLAKGWYVPFSEIF